MTNHSIQILPVTADQHAAWLPLWRGYQSFYKTDIAPEVSSVTWSRFLDPTEPMGAALAWDGPTAVGWCTIFGIDPAGPSATMCTCRIYS